MPVIRYFSPNPTSGLAFFDDRKSAFQKVPHQSGIFESRTAFDLYFEPEIFGKGFVGDKRLSVKAEEQKDIETGGKKYQSPSETVFDIAKRFLP